MRIKSKKVATFFVALFVIVVFIACTRKVVMKPVAVNAEERGERVTPLYSQPVVPLSTEECGRCHITVYDTIRIKGTKHKLECVYCHKQYHTYSPRKQNYDEIIPHCQECHGTPHGESLTQCLACHVEAHAPGEVPVGEALKKQCYNCHQTPPVQLQKYPSKHTTVACVTCHTRHGEIPQCATCHEPHTPGLTEQECLSCHPVHTPLQIVYPDTTPQEKCAGCHDEVIALLKQSGTKHSLLTCALCHPKHKEIMACTQCHPSPHSAGMLQKFPSCGDCHGVAHGLLH